MLHWLFFTIVHSESEPIRPVGSNTLECHTWTQRDGYYVQEGHGVDTECYPTLDEAKTACLDAGDCGAIAIQSNWCDGQYRVTHGGPTFSTFFDEWETYGLRSWELVATDCVEPPRACCLAMTADCLACAENMSVEDYCEMHPETAGCQSAAIVLILNGENPMKITQGGSYVDPGVFADGGEDFAIATKSNVNENVPGRYMIKYDAYDSAGNLAGTAEREVIVTARTTTTAACNLEKPGTNSCNPRFAKDLDTDECRWCKDAGVDCNCACDKYEEYDSESGVCETSATRPLKVRKSGETCGYVFGIGEVGDCVDGLICACVGACADPMVADAPSKCIRAETDVPCANGEECGTACHLDSSWMGDGVCDGMGSCVPVDVNPCAIHGCVGKSCGDDCLMGDIVGKCNTFGICDFDLLTISCGTLPTGCGSFLEYCNSYEDLQAQYCGSNVCSTQDQESACENHYRTWGQSEGRDCPVEPTEPPRACCAAMTADCLACSENMSVEDYCEMYPETIGCQPVECPPILCRMHCENGYVQENGCDICECISDEREIEVCPEGCITWYDGCNNCICNGGEATICTLKGCSVMEDAYCAEYHEPVEVCPKGCTTWYDGCNNCKCEGGETTICTLMGCSVMGDAYCAEYEIEGPIVTEDPKEPCISILCESGCDLVGADERGCGGECMCSIVTEDPKEPCISVLCESGCDLVGADESGCGGECICPSTKQGSVHQCAAEYGTCACSGNVVYGYGDRWSEPLLIHGSTQCSNDIFGDPYFGQEKVCMCTPSEVNIEEITDACDCPDGYGWNKIAKACKEGSTTSCDECETMANCEPGSCHMHGCYGYMPHFTCQCTPACEEYDNCCSDQHACNTCQEEEYCSEDVPCSTFCHPDQVCPCTCGHIPTTSPSMHPTYRECDMSIEQDFCGIVPCEDICDESACPCTCYHKFNNLSTLETSIGGNAEDMAELNRFATRDTESASELMFVTSNSVSYGLAIIGFMVVAYMLIKILFFKKNRDGFIPVDSTSAPYGSTIDSTSAQLSEC